MGRRALAAVAAVGGLGLILAGARVETAGGEPASDAAPDPAGVVVEPPANAMGLQAETSRDDAARVDRFLAAVRGAGPLTCELARRGAFESWNGGTAVRPVPGTPHAAAEVADWANRRVRDAAAIQALTDGIRDPDPCVRSMAARMLGRSRQTAATRALMRALASDDVATRIAGALGLGEAEAVQAVPDLAAALQRDDHPHVRSTAAFALGRIESPRTTPALVQALRDGHPDVRINAAWALAEIEDREAVMALVQVLSNDGDARVRRAAAWALGEILG